MQTKTRKAVVAHKIIETGEGLLNLVWSRADARRAASLEIIARTAYTAEESACHYLETIGLDREGQFGKHLSLPVIKTPMSKPMRTSLRGISMA